MITAKLPRQCPIKAVTGFIQRAMRWDHEARDGVEIEIFPDRWSGDDPEETLWFGVIRDVHAEPGDNLIVIGAIKHEDGWSFNS